MVDFNRILRRTWVRGMDELGYEQMGNLVVSSDIFRWLMAEERMRPVGRKPEELIAYGLPVRENGRLAPEIAYVEAKEVV